MPDPTLKKDTIIAWADLEMTGLEPDKDVIIQIALFLTDTSLNKLTKPINIDIWQPESKLEQMTPFVRKMHEKTGLLSRVRKSEIDLKDAEKKVLELVSKHAPYNTAVLAGNSIWQDRRFIQKYMPQLDGYLHYRMLDISSVKLLSNWWYKKKYKRSPGAKHDALYDIEESIAELKFYKDNILKEL